MSEDYIPFGNEWKKEMMNFKKVELIDLFRIAHQEKEQLEAELARIKDGLCEHCECKLFHEQPCHCCNDE